MTQYPKSTDFQGATFIGKWGKTQTPIYDVPSMHSLNQLVGYVKHINAGNGTVLYRGQCKLYEKVIPSIKHDLSKESENSKKLNNTIENVLNDNPLKHFLGLKKAEITGWHLYESLVVEAMLQHYGATTYCVDFVDNHWTALWFGLYEWNSATTQYKIRSNSFPKYNQSLSKRPPSNLQLSSSRRRCILCFSYAHLRRMKNFSQNN